MTAWAIRLVGEGFPIEARVLAIADTFDAMTSDRPCRPGLPVAKGLDIISMNAGPEWDAALVPVFLDLYNAGAMSLAALAPGIRRPGTP